MSEARRPSIVDMITRTQGEAWGAFNNALNTKSRPLQEAYREVGTALYSQAQREKVQAQNEISDSQNKVVDAGLQLAQEGEKVLVFNGTK